MKTDSCSLAICAILALGLLTPQAARAQTKMKSSTIALDSLTQGDTLWELTPEKADEQFAKSARLQWLSESKKDRALIKRHPFSNVTQTLQIGGGKLNLEEVTLEFTSGKLSSLAFSIWNRGDSEDFQGESEKQFKQRITEMTATLDVVFGSKGTDLGVDRTSAAKFARVQWAGAKLAAQLEYSGGKTAAMWQAEFVRLRIAPPLKRAAVGSGPTTIGGSANRVSRADLVKNVQTSSGEISITGVPMVDQGMKGYCAVASCQRIFNYYGMNVDEHEMAQVAETGSSRGTSSRKLMETLDQLEGKLKVRFKKLYDLNNYKDFSNMLSDYNRVSRKHGAAPLDIERADLADMNPKDLQESRSKGTDYTKFQKLVKQYIDKGVPLLWSLQLGLYPENGEPAMQSGGGHMRIIIGYNFTDPAKPILVFSDSWGAGHEKKTMLCSNAFAATTGLIALEPQT